MSRKTIHIPLSPPDDPHGPATFIHNVEACLEKQPGIYGVHILPSDHQTTLELDYDPDLLSLAQIDRHVQQAGGGLDASIGHLVLPIWGLLTPRNEHTVQTMLNKLPGVTATVSFASQTLRVEFDRRRCALPEIVRRLDQMGLRVGPDPTGAGPSTTDSQHRPIPGWLESAWSQPDLILAVVGGGFLLLGLIVGLAGGPAWVRWALLATSYLCCSWYLAPDVFKAIGQLRLDIDVLMVAAAGGAAVLGHLEEGALLLVLFGLGNAGQRLAMNRARRAIQSLAKLAPQTATLLVDGQNRREVPVEDLRVGDQILVSAGEQISADGSVVSGNSAVDQSPITGESVPVDKTVGDEVFAGTLNGSAVLTIHVDKPADQSVLKRVIKLVEEAQTTKSPTQLFTDRIERWYVPVVLGVTVILLVGPPLLGVSSARNPSHIWAGWFYQAMAFLTAASPCALAIGTPAAVLSGIARTARAGVLVKGGAHLENLGQVTVIAFDKTGTLTTGRPQITDVVCLHNRVDQTRLLALAAAVERGSNHPLALTITAEADARECPRLNATEIEQTPGLGIHGRVEHQRVTVGRWSIATGSSANAAEPKQPAAYDCVQRLESQGKTTMVVALDNHVVGVIAMADQPRPQAKAMIDKLKRLGIRKTIMVTGDNPQTARAVARDVGVDQVHAQLLPEDKQKKIGQLTRQFGKVAMFGDGVNDAPALASATVGIAIGGASGGGSDVALETADVVLLANDLNKLPEAIGVSRFTRRVIVQNLVLALGVIAILAPLAAMGQTTIYASVMFHEGSTVVVVLNGLRILGYRRTERL